MSGKNEIVAGIRLNGEKEFRQGVTNVNKSLTAMKSELGLVSAQYDGQANSLEALRAKQEILNRILEEQKKKVEATKEGLNHAKESYDSVGKGLEKLWIDLEKATDKMQDIEKTYGSASEEAKKQREEVEKLNAAIARGEENYVKAGNRVKDWETKLNTAEAQVLKANSAVNKNAAYMEEAEKAIDKCATSINAFGKEVKDVNAKTDTFMDSLKANLTGTVIIEGVKKIGSVMKEMAKDSIEAGSSFEAAMSEVEAVSGASGKDLENLTEKAKELGSSTKFSATEAAEAMNYMAMAGWKTGDMLNGIEGIMDLAAASGEDLATTSDIVTDALTALGMTAADSGHFADILAAASSNANTNVSMMGETFKYCAPVAGALGYTAEDTAEAIGLMANAGIKSSQAGTAMRGMLTSLNETVTFTGDAFGETTVKTTNYDGSMRKLGDILRDCRAAFAKMSESERAANAEALVGKNAMSGFLAVMNAAPADVEKLNSAINNCDGAAKDMAATMQNNLQGAITELKSAEEGLGITLYEKVSGPLTEGVRMATGLISGLTKNISEEKSIVSSYIDELNVSNDSVSQAIENAENIVSSAKDDIARLEGYKNTLIDLNGVEEKTEFQKYQMSQIVSELSDIIPELSVAYDEQTGSINMTDTELKKLIETNEAYLLQKAAIEAQQEAYKALYDAEMGIANAAAAVEAAEKSRDDYLKGRPDLVQALANGEMILDHQYQQLNSDLRKAQKAQNDLNGTQEEAEKVYSQFSVATEKANDRMRELGITAEDMKEKTEEASDAASDFSDSASSMADEVSEAFQTMSGAIEESIKSSIDMFNEFDGGTEITIEKIQENLESQSEGIAEWSENMQKLGGAAGEGMSQELYDYLVEMGPKSANLVKTLVKALDNDLEKGTETFKTTCDKWKEAMELKDVSKTVAGYSSAGDGIQEVLHETKEEAVNTVKEGVQETVEAMAEGQAEIEKTGDAAGKGYAQALASEAAFAEAAALEVSDAAIRSAEAKESSFRTSGEGAGQEYSEGIESAKGKVRTSSSEVAAGAVEGAASHAGEMEEVGYNMSAGMAQGIRNGESMAVQAAIDVAVAAIKAAKKALNEHSPSRVFRDDVGYNIPAGMALGIKAGKKDVQNASVEMAKAALKASKEELEIHSPSEKFKRDVGKQICQGLADGISENKKLTGDAAKEMSAQTYAESVDWLKKYKKAHDVSLEDEKYYWQQVMKQVKRGTEAYQKAREKMNAADFGSQIKKNFGIERGDSDDETYYKNILNAAQKYLSNYEILHNVSVQEEINYWNKIKKTLKSGTQVWYDVTKTIKTLKETQKQQQKAANDAMIADAEDNIRKQKILGKMDTQSEIDYWRKIKATLKGGTDAWYDAKEKIKELKEKQAEEAEAANNAIVSRGEDYIRKQKILGKMSVQQELNCWKMRLALVEKESDAWYDIMEKINDLQEELNEDAKEAAQKAIEDRAKVQDKLLSSYKTYHKMSAKAEAEYWDIARKQFREGTDERLKADEKYFDALRQMYDDRRELDEQYAEDQKDINNQMLESIADLEKAYKDAVASRKQEILSSMNLFDAWDSSGYDGDTLLYNLKTQVAGLALWEQQLEELSRKNLSGELLEELRSMGPDAAASIYSLNQMTAEQLEEYERLWLQRKDLAESQAVKENEPLRQEANDEIAKIRKDAQAELEKLNADYEAELAEMETGLTDGLKNLVSRAGNIAEESISALVAGLSEKADSVEMYNSTQKVVNNISESLRSLEQDGQVIGGNTLDGILKGLTDESKIGKAAKEAIESVKRAMQEAAEIHSPSKLFEKEVGIQITAGVGKGLLEGSADVIGRAKKMMNETLRAARTELNNVGSAGDVMNQITQEYAYQAPTISVDTGDLLSAIGRVLDRMNSIEGKMENLQVVLDSGELVGEIQPLMSQESAMVTLRKGRGRM